MVPCGFALDRYGCAVDCTVHGTADASAALVGGKQRLAAAS